jgi:hypothetical protein
MMKVAAIDPGLTGGVAIVDSADLFFTWRPMPLLVVQANKRSVKRRWIDDLTIHRFFAMHAVTGGRIDTLVLEQQNPMPRQSAGSTMTLGANFGHLRSLALSMSHAKIVAPWPATWKKDLGIGPDKKKATQLCRDIFGERSPTHDGPAEALLMCFWYIKRREIDGNRADVGLVVEPYAVRTRIPFLEGHDPSRSGTGDLNYSPPRGGPAGRLFSSGDRNDGAQAGASRRSRRK